MNSEGWAVDQVATLGPSARVGLDGAAANCKDGPHQLLLTEMCARHQELAQELHDSVASSLAAVSLLLGAAQEVANASTARLIMRAQDQIRQAAEQVRKISRGVLSDVGAAPLLQALEQLAADLRSSGRVVCHVRERGDAPELNLLCRTHVYRIAQEAVTNAIRHGNAGQIQISLIHLASGVSRLVVRDNGRSCDFGAIPLDHPGIGLQSMQARTEQLAGKLTLHGLPGCGCTVRLTWGAARTKAEPAEPGAAIPWTR